MQTGHARTQAAEAAARRFATEEAAKTISHVISGSIVTFSAGLDISDLLTGFETCTIHIGNLPVDMTQDDIHALLRGHSPDVDCFHIVKVEKQDWRLEAYVVADVASGEELASALNGVKFENETLMAEVSNSPDGMSAADDQSPEILTITWRAPSARYLAAFDDVATANTKVEQLRDYCCDGRRIKVDLNIPPLDLSGSDLLHNAIRINNLPPTVTPKKVMDITGSKTVRRLPILGLFKQPTVEEIARDILHDIERAVPGGLKKFDNPSNTCTEEGDVFARAHFSTWDEARVAYTDLRYKRYGSQLLRLELRDPMSFMLYIPETQYRAQKTQWDSLSESVKDNKACAFYTSTSGNRVQIILEGSVKETVGALKVRVESLAWGEMVEGWHRSLGIPGNLFASRVYSVTGAYLRADCEQELLKVYGTPTAVDRARAMIKDELNRLASLDYTVTIEPGSVGFFVREGISQLKEKFGEDSVRFVMSFRKITISGGEEARRTLDRLIALSSKGSSDLHNASQGSLTCPICYDGVSSPIQLGCGHTYCVTCLRLFILSALESDRVLPLTCLGDEARCRASIPIPTMQQILSPASLNRLLEAAFDAYIAKHPREFKHCKTQDCTRVYRAVRAGAAPQTLHCPSCFSAVCNGCYEEAHDGLSCAQSKARRSLAEQERLDEAWIASQAGRVKRCPQCCKPIEKDERCNVVSCRYANSFFLNWLLTKSFDMCDRQVRRVCLLAVHGDFDPRNG